MGLSAGVSPLLFRVYFSAIKCIHIFLLYVILRGSSTPAGRETSNIHVSMFPCGETLQPFKFNVRGADLLERFYGPAGHAAKFQLLAWGSHIPAIDRTSLRYGSRGSL
jgi:hypothetical protein